MIEPMPDLLIDTGKFQQDLATTDSPLPLFRAALSKGSEGIQSRFKQGNQSWIWCIYGPISSISCCSRRGS